MRAERQRLPEIALSNDVDLVFVRPEFREYKSIFEEGEQRCKTEPATSLRERDIISEVQINIPKITSLHFISAEIILETLTTYDLARCMHSG